MLTNCKDDKLPVSGAIKKSVYNFSFFGEGILGYVRSSRGPACSLMASCCRDSSSRSSCIWSLSCSNSCSRLPVTCTRKWHSVINICRHLKYKSGDILYFPYCKALLEFGYTDRTYTGLVNYKKNIDYHQICPLSAVAWIYTWWYMNMTLETIKTIISDILFHIWYVFLLAEILTGFNLTSSYCAYTWVTNELRQRQKIYL